MPGYLDGFNPPMTASPLIDGTIWTGDELFWSAFLLHVGMARSAPEAFGADLADLDAYLDRFDRPEAWPVFTISVGGGTMHLIVCNFPDDSGIDWVLDPVALTAVDHLAAEEGAYRGGSALPWPLLPHEAIPMLMALPAVGDHDIPQGVPEMIGRALYEVGATQLVEELTEELLNHRACVLLQ